MRTNRNLFKWVKSFKVHVSAQNKIRIQSIHSIQASSIQDQGQDYYGHVHV